MCGIAGIVGVEASGLLARMTSLQTHRGPSDSGLWETRLGDGTYVGLGSRRLAILDLSPAGHMPMSTPDGRFTIVYNGEVYNYPELRRELEAKGVRFRSDTDTEAVLYLYREYGRDSVRRLNGMFAFAIWDRDEQALFLARDHAGIKPLYYYRSPDGGLAFASEMKSLLEIPGLRREIDPDALHQYLTFLWVPDPLTLVKGIFKLAAGHYAELRDGKFRIGQYWDLTFPPADHHYGTSEADLVAELRTRFNAAVRSQLMADVPLGSFLSAGLDSTSIVAAMAAAGVSRPKTYTIGFPPRQQTGGLAFDDIAVARRTAEFYGCEHTEIIVEPDVADLLPKVVWHMDEPVADPAAIMAYLVSREASKSVTVLLSGVGGDELFAGYRKHIAHYLARKYQRIPKLLRGLCIEPVVHALPALPGTRMSGLIRLAKKMARSGSLAPRERFVMDSTYLTDGEKDGLYTPEARARAADSHSWERHLAYFEKVHEADFLNQMLYLDTKAFMVSLNLTYNDRMSMASSVEVRVPFLDRELMEWVAWSVPPHLKLKDRQVPKHILREAMRPCLPAEVLNQRKAGFGAPVGDWLKHDLRDMVNDLLAEPVLVARGLLRPAAVRGMIDEHCSGRADRSLQLWMLVTLELWMRTFLDGAAPLAGPPVML